MESIFAKPPASTSHNYIYLLQKKEIIGQNFKDQFSNNLPSPVHLYSSSGKGLGHRKVSSNERRSPEYPVQEALTEQIFMHSDNLVEDFSLENLRLKSELAEARLLSQELSEKIKSLEQSIQEERRKTSRSSGVA